MHPLVGVWTAAAGRGDVQPQSLHDRYPSRLASCPGSSTATGPPTPRPASCIASSSLTMRSRCARFKAAVEGNSRAQARVGISYDSLSIVEIKTSASRAESDNDGARVR
jgi:hypothetical protein